MDALGFRLMILDYLSRLMACGDSAVTIKQQLEIIKMVVDDKLKEINNGKLEGGE